MDTLTEDQQQELGKEKKRATSYLATDQFFFSFLFYFFKESMCVRRGAEEEGELQS